MKFAPIPQVQQSLSHTNDVGARAFGLAHRLEVPIWIFDVDHRRVLFANIPACKLWQSDTEVALRKRNFGADMSQTVTQRLKQYQSAFIAGDETFTEQWTLYPNGVPKTMLIRFRGFPLDDGRMAMQCEAISEVSQTPQNLRSAEALLYTDVLITLFSRDGPPLYHNPAAQKVLGGPHKCVSDLIVDKSVYETLLSQVDVVGEHRVVARVNTVDGQRWFDLSAKSCADAATGQPSILLTAFDVSALKEARDTARRLANRDQLTNLHNRAYLQSFFDKLGERPQLEECALVFFDVDRFKQINDRYGHETGDCVLKHIAKQCCAVTGAADVVARIGGDEFVIILAGVKSRAALTARIAELRLSIGRPFLDNERKLDVQISIGIATFSPRLSRFETVLRKADLALYASKEGGRNKATFYTEEMGAAAHAREQIEVELRQALRRNEFELFYQPRFDLATNRVVGAEGLVRWKHPSRGLIMPNEFITICEENGMIDELGRLVLEMGCLQAIAWHKQGRNLEMSLNVSPRQFNNSGLLNTLHQFSRRPDFPTGKIELEITENALIGQHDAIEEKLNAIAAMGYRIAIDDFGSGYSNLSYISRFPLSCLKIDRSFIDQLPGSGPIVELIITLGHQLGATVVSEGVETQEQLDWLSENKCTQVQGYLIARPMPLSDFMDFVGAKETTNPATQNGPK